MKDVRYDLAISFAGEDRKIAEDIANRLTASGYRVFYDSYKTGQLWGGDLTVLLGDIYENQARFCLIIISEVYIKKMWTNHERKFALSAFMTRGDDYVLPLKLDDSNLPSLPKTTGYIDFRQQSVKNICDLLKQKLGKPLENIEKETTDISSVGASLGLPIWKAAMIRVSKNIQQKFDDGTGKSSFGNRTFDEISKMVEEEIAWISRDSTQRIDPPNGEIVAAFMFNKTQDFLQDCNVQYLQTYDLSPLEVFNQVFADWIT